MRIWAGIDPGERRIGIARSDPSGMLASPAGVVGNPDELCDLLSSWAEGGSLAGVIVGLPRNMDGSYGPMARRSARLARVLRDRIGTAVLLWDERLTTRQASRSGAGGKGARGLDERAAAILLQSFLDAGAPVVPDPQELEE